MMTGIEMETVIKMNRSSTIVLPTTIRKRFKASRFDLKRGAGLVLLALAISISWLYLASAALPDNNSSIGAVNYIVVNSNNPIITGILGAVVGALATGFVLVWLLEQKLKRETAIKFLHEHYLPLLGTLHQVVYAWYVWTNDSLKENVELSDKETTQFFSEDVLELSQTIESAIRSGAVILLYRINRKTYDNIVALDYLLKDYQYNISHKNAIIRDSDDDLTVAFNKLTRQIEDLTTELEKMSMPKLIEEYQRMMKDDAPIMPES